MNIMYFYIDINLIWHLETNKFQNLSRPPFNVIKSNFYKMNLLNFDYKNEYF